MLFKNLRKFVISIRISKTCHTFILPNLMYCVESKWHWKIDSLAHHESQIYCKNRTKDFRGFTESELGPRLCVHYSFCFETPLSILKWKIIIHDTEIYIRFVAHWVIPILSQWFLVRMHNNKKLEVLCNE